MKLLTFALIVAAGPLFARAPEVPLVTSSRRGQEHRVPTSEWEKVVSQVSQSLEGQVLTSLDQSQVPFKLKSIVVGLGVNAEVGITHVLSLGAQARVKLIFCPKGQAPVVP